MSSIVYDLGSKSCSFVGGFGRLKFSIKDLLRV